MKTDIIKELFMGFCLGTANIIPGVSGGTFLLIFNIYERVFAIVNRINRDLLLETGSHGICLFKNLGRRGSVSDFVTFLERNDLIFLLKLLAGAVSAILGLSALMKYLLIHHFSLTYSLFFGLILVSILIPVRLLKSRKIGLVFFVLAGCGLTILVTLLVNPYDKAKLKSDSYQVRYETQGALDAPGAGAKPAGIFSYTGKYTISEYLYAGVCGAVSVSAMVLPGVSGSLVMILMGTYFDVISAISALKLMELDTFLFLGSFSLGIVLGGLMFARLINFFLARYYNATMAFLLGLMAGSLWALWPFKKIMVLARQYVKQDGWIVVREDVEIYTNINALPPLDMHLMLACLFFLLGCVVMAGFMRTQPKE